MSIDVENTPLSLHGKRIGFAGKLGGVSRREASRIVKEQGGIPVDDWHQADIVVIGADELLWDDDAALEAMALERPDQEMIEIIHETDLWNRLGLLENQTNIRRLYTPAMLAQLLRVPISVIRRWHRRGLIVPVREVHRLPYFDFQEIATARRLAELLAAGASSAAIERKLEQLARLVPGIDRPLSQLSVIVEGRQILLRQGEGLIQSDGQRWFDFDSGDQASRQATAAAVPQEATLRISQSLSCERPPMSIEDMVSLANDMEDSGRYADAIDIYRAVLMSGGVDASICFRLAELLYLVGDKAAARERYSMAIELDEDFVEARANLGCVLAEQEDLELAVAAFQGALRHHTDYPDAHFHLARVLDELKHTAEAEPHWRQFLALAPDSPWADVARTRLNISPEVG